MSSKEDFHGGEELTAEQKKRQREEKKAAKAAKKTGAADKKPTEVKGEKKSASEKKDEKKKEEKKKEGEKKPPVGHVPKQPSEVKVEESPTVTEDLKPIEERMAAVIISVKEETPAKIESSIRDSFIQLKLGINIGSLTDSDDLCLRLIEAFKRTIADYKTPGEKSFKRGIEAVVKPQLSYLTDGRPLPISMGSLVKQLKYQITELPENCTEEEGKQSLTEWLDDFVDVKINLARQSVSQEAGQRLINGCTVMIYSSSSLIEKVITDANSLKQKFSVVVVGSYDDQPAKEMLKRLVLREKISCSYIALGAIHYALDRINLILLSAEGLLANGNVIVKRGSTLLALAAQRRNIPVLVACPTYKFCEKVITGTLDPTLTGLGHSETEVMPGDLVTGVVTELRIQTCSAAPAVLKIKQPIFE